MFRLDQEYLDLCDTAHSDPSLLLRNSRFLESQSKFFSVLQDLEVTLDCDIADVREVHVMAALADQLKGATVIDVGCGSFEAYVKDSTDIRDNYPPLMAECLQRMGSSVTGVDIRPNAKASYDHRMLDVMKSDWTNGLATYDLVLCFSVFNAPDAQFRSNPSLCAKLMQDLSGILRPGGLMVLTLPEHLFPTDAPLSVWSDNVRCYLAPFGLRLVHCGRTAVWATDALGVSTVTIV